MPPRHKFLTTSTKQFQLLKISRKLKLKVENEIKAQTSPKSTRITNTQSKLTNKKTCSTLTSKFGTYYQEI